MSLSRSFSHSLFQVLTVMALMVCICKGYNIPLSWSRRDMPNCMGMFGNRDLYEDVSRICSDCQNVFRDKAVENKCRSECFTTSYFETCVMALELTDKLPDYKMHASILKGGRK